jgi:uncharacterized repeat protein (TIGR03803 family)
VTLDTQGNIFGTTVNSPTLWEIAKGSGTITVLATSGVALYAGVTLDGQGNLYGTASSGGTSGDGSIWEIAKGSGAMTTLASFDGTDGASPFSGLTLGRDGTLYGTANEGGDGGVGTVYQLTGAVVPEPPGAVLLGLGALVLAGFARVRMRQ